VATLSTIRIVRLLGGGSRLLALCGGLATAICFQPPFGTVNYEQTAMFFNFLALQAVVEALGASGRRRDLWQLAGGFSLALAALSKRNFGLFFIPIVFAVLAAGELPAASLCTWRVVISAGRSLISRPARSRSCCLSIAASPRRSRRTTGRTIAPLWAWRLVWASACCYVTCATSQSRRPPGPVGTPTGRCASGRPPDW
jgi:hypothetical protein